jgi:hypothetical protein
MQTGGETVTFGPKFPENVHSTAAAAAYRAKFLSTCIRRRKAAIATKSRKEETGGSE